LHPDGDEQAIQGGRRRRGLESFAAGSKSFLVLPGLVKAIRLLRFPSARFVPPREAGQRLASSLFQGSESAVGRESLQVAERRAVGCMLELRQSFEEVLFGCAVRGTV